MAEQKKIELNFNGLPADAVRQIAAATVGTVEVVEVVELAGVGDNRLPDFAREVSRISDEQMKYARIIQAASSILQQVSDTVSTIDQAVKDMEKAAPPSLMGRLLGKRTPVSAHDIGSAMKLVKGCHNVVDNLSDQFMKTTSQINDRMKKNEALLLMAEDCAGQEGMDVRRRIYEAKDRFNQSAGEMKKMHLAARAYAARCQDAAAKIDKIAKGNGLTP
jgi:Mg2+ and Co2+ transporter CorA